MSKARTEEIDNKIISMENRVEKDEMGLTGPIWQTRDVCDRGAIVKRRYFCYRVELLQASLMTEDCGRGLAGTGNAACVKL
jgi:hypothetical protein